ncbi:hypothetical protein [Actinomadura macrotermitis]|uniref:Uncharacterized protein n=1 Tax=Actinomadura macrotermitis TaxID=2585200 RepID=A0A7K0C7M6_9ACTN|nr:hypothetical protein [Actinomadura macrotermitis]
MITFLVLASLGVMFGLCLTRLLRSQPATRRVRDDPPDTGGYPESMTAELEQGDEEYLAALAAELWPDDEYLEMEPSKDGDDEAGGSMAV